MDIKNYFKSPFRVMEKHKKDLVIKEGKYAWHIKRGGKVLLVAHIDTVQKPKIHQIKDGIIYAQGLDDRLGVYMALCLLGERKDVDVLITNDEEIGASTAKIIPTEDLDYNCIIGLDRAGMDFVDYDLANEDLLQAYEEYAPYGYGSFSDICFLKDPPCGCINVGIGYQRAHDKDSFALISDIKKSYDNICSFLDKYGDTHFAPMEQKPKYYDDWDYSVDEEDSFLCSICGEYLAFEGEREVGLCIDCLSQSYYDYSKGRKVLS